MALSERGEGLFVVAMRLTFDGITKVGFLAPSRDSVPVPA
jgi:hypothetical protein